MAPQYKLINEPLRDCYLSEPNNPTTPACHSAVENKNVRTSRGEIRTSKSNGACVVSSWMTLKQTIHAHQNAMIVMMWGYNEQTKEMNWMLPIPWNKHLNILTLMLLAANFGNTKWCKISEKWLNRWHIGTHCDWRVLSESYLMNTYLTGFKLFSRTESLCFGRK